MNQYLNINPEKETEKIVKFLKDTFRKQGIKNVVIGLSGGIDSTVCYYLLKKTLPKKNIFPVYLPYYNTPVSFQNVPTIRIKTIVDEVIDILKKSADINLRATWEVRNPPPAQAGEHAHWSRANSVSSDIYKIRAGNIMSRVRMIILFDLAKKHQALVCGTENKSEHLLGYFTRFGDGASDIEPIRHLYKTQIYQIAKYLEVPKEIINQKPSAGLWKNQTDEGQFGFTYKEADQVLNLYFDQKKSTKEILFLGYSHAKKIITYAKKNQFKQETPYAI